MWCNVNLHRPDDVVATWFTFITWYIVGITVLEFCTLVKCIQSQNTIKIMLCPLAVRLPVQHWPLNEDNWCIRSQPTSECKPIKMQSPWKIRCAFQWSFEISFQTKQGASTLMQHCKCIMEDADKFFDIFMVMCLMTLLFCDMTQRLWVNVCWRFERTYCLPLEESRDPMF